MPHVPNVLATAKAGTEFRRVLMTGEKSQTVIMSIPPGGDVGEERHDHVEQTLIFLEGSGEGMLGGKSYPIAAGDAVVVPPGTLHNFRNTGATPLQIITVYAPPNHIAGRVHATKEEAEVDQADEEFGHHVPS